MSLFSTKQSHRIQRSLALLGTSSAIPPHFNYLFLHPMITLLGLGYMLGCPKAEVRWNRHCLLLLHEKSNIMKTQKPNSKMRVIHRAGTLNQPKALWITLSYSTTTTDIFIRQLTDILTRLQQEKC